MDTPFTGRETAEEILLALDGWARACSDRSEKQALWDMLTGLRGPDSGSQETKDITTAKLRAAICPALATAGFADVDSQTTQQEIADLRTYGDHREHFDWHVQHAAVALATRSLLMDRLLAPK